MLHLKLRGCSDFLLLCWWQHLTYYILALKRSKIFCSCADRYWRSMGICCIKSIEDFWLDTFFYNPSWAFSSHLTSTHLWQPQSRASVTFSIPSPKLRIKGSKRHVRWLDSCARADKYLISVLQVNRDDTGWIRSNSLRACLEWTLCCTSSSARNARALWSRTSHELLRDWSCQEHQHWVNINVKALKSTNDVCTLLHT